MSLYVESGLNFEDIYANSVNIRRIYVENGIIYTNIDTNYLKIGINYSKFVYIILNLV